uniref:MICOS complex subunit n=2 Tax=Parascaris univalens TaxID=6257 RepID=A0A914ZI45_PARUN
PHGGVKLSLCGGVEATKEEASEVVKRSSAMTTATEKRPAPQGTTLLTVNELPIYAEDIPVRYTFIPDDPLPLQGTVSKVRKALVHKYDAFAQRFQLVDRTAKRTMHVACGLSEHLREEWSMLPKMAAITVGGMAGFVLGMKKSGFRRVLYSTVGVVTMAAFCYPHETVRIIRTGVAHTKNAWYDFKESPEPPMPKHDFSPNRNDEVASK